MRCELSMRMVAQKLSSVSGQRVSEIRDRWSTCLKFAIDLRFGAPPQRPSTTLGSGPSSLGIYRVTGSGGGLCHVVSRRSTWTLSPCVVDGVLTIGQIAEKIDRHPAMVSSWLKRAARRLSRRRRGSVPVIDDRWTARIDRLLEANPELSATSVERILRAEGYTKARREPGAAFALGCGAPPA